MEEKPFKASARSSSRHDSAKASSDNDIRNLWTTALLSHPKIQMTNVYEVSELEGSSIDPVSSQWLNQKTGHDSDGGWEHWDERQDEGTFEQEELDLRPRRPLRSDLEEDEDSRTKTERPSAMSFSVSKRTPHRAYWMEQQNRLPLPLMELMESEALEILTKALQSYRSKIGGNHFLTKQLQRYVEGLRRRLNKRPRVPVH